MDEMVMEFKKKEDEAKSNESDVVEPRIRDVWHASQETCMGFGARLAACASLRLSPPSPFSYKSLPLHFPAHLSLLMDWLHKMKRAWLAVSSRIRPRKSGGSVGRLGGGGGGGCCNGDYGLLNLRDDVQMCTYQDVQVMWNMLSGSQQNDVSSAKSVAHQPLESSKQRRPSWRLVFWSNRRDDTSSSFR